MKRNCLILTVIGVAYVCLLQAGCLEKTQETPESKPEAATPMAMISAAKTEAKPAAETATKIETKLTVETKSEASKTGPKITFEKVVHNFDNVGPGTKHTCEFEFKNTGNALLRITRVTKSCGCTPFTLAKKEYKPGESGTLKVRYHAGRRPSTTSKTLYVYSNDKARPKVKLTLKAKIVVKVKHEPKKLELLLKGENAGCPEITLRSIDNQAFAIKQFSSTGNCITADVNSLVKATEFTLQPKVDLQKLQENLRGNITLKLTHPECSSITIAFSTLPRFQAKPPMLNLWDPEPQKPVTRKLSIVNNYGEDFEIESTSSKKGMVKVLSQKKVANGYDFELQITPPAATTKLKYFKDAFSVNIKGGEKLEIICTGFYSKKVRK